MPKPAKPSPTPTAQPEQRPHGPVKEQFMKKNYGPSGFVPKRVGLESVAVEGIWLRCIGDWVEVLVEIERKWKTIIREHFDGPFSHICEPSGIAQSSNYLEHDAPTPAAQGDTQMVSVNEPRFTCPICEDSVAESYRSQHMKKHPAQQADAHVCDHCGYSIHKTGVAWVHDLTGTSACALVATPRRVQVQGDELTAEQLVVDICRELYDRFVMGGWQAEEGHDYIREILKAHAAERVRLETGPIHEELQRVYQVNSENYALRCTAERKLAESEQRFKDADKNFEEANARSEAAERLNRELREALPHFLAHEIWTEWHGPLAKIPGTHDDCVSSLRDMIERFVAERLG